MKKVSREGGFTMKTRDDAYKLLTTYTKSEALIRHGLAVEAAMRHYASLRDGDVEAWGVAGLLHDFDYEMYPTLEDHPVKGSKILREAGYPEEIITAILGHGNHTGVPRETAMAHTLFACDELSGLVMAVAMVKGRQMALVEASSVLKKMKDKAFARGVNRDDVVNGAMELGLPLEEHVANVVEALKEAAPSLGL